MGGRILSARPRPPVRDGRSGRVSPATTRARFAADRWGREPGTCCHVGDDKGNGQENPPSGSGCDSGGNASAPRLRHTALSGGVRMGPGTGPRISVQTGWGSAGWGSVNRQRQGSARNRAGKHGPAEPICHRCWKVRLYTGHLPGWTAGEHSTLIWRSVGSCCARMTYPGSPGFGTPVAPGCAAKTSFGTFRRPRPVAASQRPGPRRAAAHRRPLGRCVLGRCVLGRCVLGRRVTHPTDTAPQTPWPTRRGQAARPESHRPAVAVMRA